ncbi:hypothetical protein GCM10020331_038990 [Ectobacillus funiculus]
MYVDSVQDEADFHIYKHAKPGDLVVTQDMGLASLLVKKGVHVLSPRGTIITDEQMDTILYNRYVSAKLRREGTFLKRPKSIFPKKTKKEISTKFTKKILSNHEGIH